jgi:hypothetical protein
LLFTYRSGNEEAVWIYGFSDRAISDFSATWISNATEVLRKLRLQLCCTVVLQLSKENLEDESLEPFLTMFEEFDGVIDNPVTVSFRG